MKLCKDCRWVADPGAFAKCKAPQNVTAASKLTGFRDEPTWIYCTTQRQGGFLMSLMMGSCGKSGRWFAPRDGEK